MACSQACNLRKGKTFDLEWYSKELHNALQRVDRASAQQTRASMLGCLSMNWVSTTVDLVKLFVKLLHQVAKMPGAEICAFSRPYNEHSDLAFA